MLHPDWSWLSRSFEGININGAAGRTERGFLRDGVHPNFAVRLRASGAMTFVYMTTRPGRKGSHAVTIAQFPKLKVAASRMQAAMLAGKRTMGIDLIADRRKQKQARSKPRMSQRWAI
jgi:hypothetical protein